MAAIRRTIHVIAWVGTLVVMLVAVMFIASQTPWFRDWLRRTIVREADQSLGVYATVTGHGRVAVGDRVELTDE